jgi:acetyl/propionyl-CoA carboxylase alpha subunit
MKISLDSHQIEITPTRPGYRVRVDGQDCPVEVLRAGAGQLTLRFFVSEEVFTAYISSDGPNRWLTLNGQTFQFKRQDASARRLGHAQAHSAGELLAPMPGQVRAVPVAQGDNVTRGQTLLVLEAMKMEIKMTAPFDGRVAQLKVRPGDTVEKEQLLVEVAPAA